MDIRGDDVTGECCIVGRGHPCPRRQFLVEDLELGQQHRRLQGIQPAIDSDMRVVIAAILPVGAELSHPFGQPIIVGEAGPSVAISLAITAAVCLSFRSFSNSLMVAGHEKSLEATSSL